MIEPVEFHMIGVSHRTAGVEVRERFALAPAALTEQLQRHAAAGQSALLLATCNRTELYWAGTDDRHDWFAEFARERGMSDLSAVIRYDGTEAVRHIFEVAAGLDSQILGETEILGQVRRAYDAARGAGTTTSEMDAIFSAALAAGRRVRRETVLGRHPMSVSSAAVDVVAERVGGLEDRQVAVLGAGEAAEGVLRALHERRARNVTLVNRGPERARALATAWAASMAPWDRLPEVLRAAEIVFVATAAKHPIVGTREFALAAGAADGDEPRHVMVVDLSVPRNVEPAAASLPTVTLLDLDDLQQLRCPVTGDALPALRDAERVLGDEIDRLHERLRGRAASPRLATLHRLGDEIVARETEWALAQLDRLSEEERAVIRQMADRLMRRVLYPVSRAVRADDL